jgi:hypothetical protein
MMRNPFHYITLVALTAYGSLGCESGGVGAPCIPEDEYNQNFNGFALTEVNVESRSFQCETRVCIVNHFQGRVSCPYGQLDPASSGLPPTDRARCRVPGSTGNLCVDPTSGNKADCTGVGTPALDDDNNIDQIEVPVDPQRVFRAAQDTVYCSCRCKGPDANAVYCECPSGFECKELVRDIGVEGRGQLVGDYCIKPGTAYDPTHPPDPQVCTIADGDANKTLTSTNRKQRKVGDICGVDGDGNASNPPI